MDGLHSVLSAARSPHFTRGVRRRAAQDVLKAAFVFGFPRTLATASPETRIIPAPPPEPVPFAIRKAPTVFATIHNFPTMEPLRFDTFPSTFLHAPLRRDILHRAVIYEGDSHRLGRAKTKWRDEVRGSGLKIRPQKGTGQARLGDRKSPMLRGGGVAHGPKPRDFSTDLPRKVYDLAWRTALSYRYRREQLVIVDGELEIQEPDPGLIMAIVEKYGWGNKGNRSLLVTEIKRPNLAAALRYLGAEARVLTKEEVDVKDLLEKGRVIIERDALGWFEEKHGVNARLKKYQRFDEEE